MDPEQPSPDLARRLELHELLQTLGAANVYFQPPSGHVIVYPAIVYERDAANERHANNDPYFRAKRYQVTVMDRDPDSEIPNRVAAIRTSSFERHFNADGLNHDVYTLYF